MLSQDAINEFKQIYQEECGVELSDEEALERAQKFLRLFYLIGEPVSKKWKKDHEN